MLEEITIEVPRRGLRRAELAALALGAQGLQVLDLDAQRAGVRLWVPAGPVAAAAKRALRRSLDEATITSRRVEATWTPRARPRRVGARFVIAAEPPTHPPAERPPAERIVILLDAAQTFGDGTHPTTALAVEALERAFDEAPRERALDVLDVGTGTGVLAIVAAHLGAREVIATDVDPLARAAARAHLARNALSDRVRVRATMPRRRFGLVVANLYRDVLLELAPALARAVAPGGALIVTGFAPASIPVMRDTFAALGLELARRRSRGGWSCLALRRQ